MTVSWGLCWQVRQRFKVPTIIRTIRLLFVLRLIAYAREEAFDYMQSPVDVIASGNVWAFGLLQLGWYFEFIVIAIASEVLPDVAEGGACFNSSWLEFLLIYPVRVDQWIEVNSTIDIKPFFFFNYLSKYSTEALKYITFVKITNFKKTFVFFISLLILLYILTADFYRFFTQTKLPVVVVVAVLQLHSM